MKIEYEDVEMSFLTMFSSGIPIHGTVIDRDVIGSRTEWCDSGDSTIPLPMAEREMSRSNYLFLRKRALSNCIGQHKLWKNVLTNKAKSGIICPK